MSQETVQISFENDDDDTQQTPLLSSSPTSDTEETIDGRLTLPLLWAVVVCTLGSSFQFGYSIGVMNMPDKVIRAWMNETYMRQHDGEHMTDADDERLWSLIVSIFAVGGMIGGLSSGMVANKFGRRGGMMANNIIALIAAAIMSTATYTDSYLSLIFGRFVIGLNAGLNSGLAPLYLTELSPLNYRGAIASAHQLVITVAIIISQILGVDALFGNAKWWPMLFAFIAVPAVFQLCTIWQCVESPVYTMNVKCNERLAEKDLIRLRGDGSQVFAELALMRKAANTVRRPCSSMLTDSTLRWALFISVVMMISQQFSGINVVIYYSSDVLRSGGFSDTVTQYATLGVGALNVLITLVSVAIIDRFGRRILHMSGLSIMLFSSVLLVVSLMTQSTSPPMRYMCIVSILIFVAGFAIGPGSIPWFYVSELFTDDTRANANSVAVGVNWTANFLVGQLFLPWKSIAGDYSMLLFSGFLLIFVAFTYFCAPETRGLTTQQVQFKLINRKI